MVLARALVVVLVCGGCKVSLFDANGGGGGDGHAGGDGQLASMCPSPCLGDAGGAFGADPFRFVDDHRDRTWSPMTAMGTTFVGQDAMNSIARCKDKSAEACTDLPGALLVSTSGSTSIADPAIEFTLPSPNRVVQLQLGVRVPGGGASQQVRLYRNSREDVLYTALADAGATLTQTVTVDGLAGDRFLVALSPTGAGAQDIGVQLFVVGDAATFPSTCQLALPMSGGATAMIDNQCGAKFTSEDFDSGTQIAPTSAAGPFAEQGMAAAFTTSHFYSSVATLDRSGDFTIQMWLRHQMLFDSVTGGWPFSDMDLDNTGGIGFVIYEPTGGGLALDMSTCTQVNPTLQFDTATITYPGDKLWHFLRVTKTGQTLAMCLDGQKLVQHTVAGTLKSTYPPYIAKNVIWTPSEPNYIGDIDDVRVFTTALPCQ